MAKEKSSILQEFKEFISQGSVIDLAVGIIIGAASTAIVTSLVNDIIMPLVGALLGGFNFANLHITIGTAVVQYGNFIQAIVNFVIIAAVIFIVIKAINKMRKTKEDESVQSEEVALLSEIRDELKRK